MAKIFTKEQQDRLWKRAEELMESGLTETAASLRAEEELLREIDGQMTDCTVAQVRGASPDRQAELIEENTKRYLPESREHMMGEKEGEAS